ncbi:MAG: DUF4056 domain-containing protein [Sedimentisphaerales bacterium]|nr:DUF4056 domain-containing protein [Sedimentisphaerales bacterium]
MLRNLTLILLLFCTSGECLSSCQPSSTNIEQLLSDRFEHKPRSRRGTLPSPTLWTNFPDPGNLGLHCYKFGLSEKNGIVYTCKAGHIDIYHVRDAADWTAFLSAKIFKHLSNNDTKFSFRFKEGSICHIQLTYPQQWENLSAKDKKCIVYNISIKSGQYLAYNAKIWHEILTWYGYRSTGLYSEFPSAFSWEDIFSNLLGSYIGVEAFEDSAHEYDDAVTLAINNELASLDVQSSEIAINAAKKMKGVWFSDGLLGRANIKKRNFDIGIDDNIVTPLIVPDICQCANDSQIQSYPVPTLDFLLKYGFSMKFEIEPKEWEKGKILRIVYPNGKTKNKCIEPARDFAVIMSRIIEEAGEKHNFHIAHLSTN